MTSAPDGPYETKHFALANLLRLKNNKLINKNKFLSIVLLYTMPKTKVKVGISFILMVVLMLLSRQFLLFINYIMALVFHEMAHIYMAKSKGYNTNVIKFDMLGASIKLDNQIQKDDVFAIAFAGPAVNSVLCLICTSVWWIVPEMYVFTADFFRYNLLLASFNMLPVEPLDGAKMLDSMLNKGSKRSSQIIALVINVSVIFLFVVLFIVSCFNVMDLTYIVFAVFFAVNMIPKRKVNFDVYYKLFFKKNKPIEKINFLHVQASCTLFEMIKHAKEGYYTIFYCELGEPIYITEQDLQVLISKNSLTSTIAECVNTNSLRK